MCCAVAGSPGWCENWEGPEVRSQREVGPEAANGRAIKVCNGHGKWWWQVELLGGWAIMARMNTRKGREGRWMGRGEIPRREEGSRSRAVVGKTWDGREK